MQGSQHDNSQSSIGSRGLIGSFGPRSTGKGEYVQEVQYRDFNHLKGHLGKYGTAGGREKNSGSLKANKNAFGQTANLAQLNNMHPGASL